MGVVIFSLHRVKAQEAAITDWRAGKASRSFPRDGKTEERNVDRQRTTLVILAAGIGSRFGGGIKQLEPVDGQGHIIMDYSIHDAIAAGFDRVIFIIRRDIEQDFRAVIGSRMEKVCEPLGVEVRYAFQELRNIPGAFPEGRVKPWGTGHAVLACDGLIDGPFAVINADDYYGREGFRKAAAFLASGAYGLVGYHLKNTLSDNGGVTRGICSLSPEGALMGIAETRGIEKTAGGAAANGKALDMEALVSMNFWCLPASFMEVLKKGFPAFLAGMENPLKDEYLLPTIVDGLLKEGVQVTVLPSVDQWFGVTYKEDKPSVTESFRRLHSQGVYQEDLYGDLQKP